MSWFKNLFKKKRKRLPARDHIGRFIADDKGNPLFTDSPQEEIDKAIARAKKRDAEIQKLLNAKAKTSEKKVSPAPKAKPEVKKQTPKKK
jgi:hypothetical protein